MIDQQLETTSSNAVLLDDHLNGAEHLNKQQSTNSKETTEQQPLNDGIFNFILPSEKDCALNPEENLEPNSVGLRSSRTRGVWHKSLEEDHSAKVKERSLFGHIMCSEETQKKILESDLFRILESEGVTEIGALYKVSPSKFVLVFGSKTAKEKLAGTEIQCRFGESEIIFNFQRRVGPLRNGKEPIFVTINLPEYISDQAVSLAFSNFGEVVSVFKGRHVRIFPAGGNPEILPRKITFHGGVRRDVLFAEKVVLCYRCKNRHMLGENCPIVSPTPEDYDMSNIEQSEAPRDKLAPEKPDSSVETQSSAELSRSQQLSRRGLTVKILRWKKLALTLI